MYQIDDVVYLQPEDQCNDCRFTKDGNNLCPLLEALAFGWVTLPEPVDVLACGAYQPIMRIVK